MRKSIEKIGGEDALEKFDMVSNLLKKVINGALIVAAIALVAKPFMPKGPRGGGGGTTPVTPICQPAPVTIPQLVTATITSLQTIVGGVLLPGAAGLIQKLLESLTNEQIAGSVDRDTGKIPVKDAVPVKDPILVKDPVGDYNWVDDLNPQQVWQILQANATNPHAWMLFVAAGLSAASLLMPADGQVLAFLGLSATVAKLKTLIAAGLLIVPATFLKGAKAEEVSLKKDVSSDDDTSTLKITVIGKKDIPKITQWYDLEDEPNFMKSIISVDELAQNTSYSNSSYGLITNNTTVIQPIIQEV